MNAPSPGAKDFVERSNLRGFVALSRDITALLTLLAVGVYADHWLIYLVVAWPIGLIQFNLGEVLAHEASHYNLFKSRRWNDRIEWILTIPFLYTIKAYREEHRLHHTKLGNQDDHLVSDYRRRGLFRIPPKLVWIWFGKPLIGLAGVDYLKSVGFSMLTKRATLKIAMLWGPILIVCSFTETLPYLIWLWVVPLLWTFPSFLWWSEIRDHFNTKTGTRSDVGWMNYLTHNNGYHYIHHQYPSIPWYLLPEAHRTLAGLQTVDVCNGFFDAFRQMLPDEPIVTAKERLT